MKKFDSDPHYVVPLDEFTNRALYETFADLGFAFINITIDGQPTPCWVLDPNAAKKVINAGKKNPDYKFEVYVREEEGFKLIYPKGSLKYTGVTLKALRAMTGALEKGKVNGTQRKFLHNTIGRPVRLKKGDKLVYLREDKKLFFFRGPEILRLGDQDSKDFSKESHPEEKAVRFMEEIAGVSMLRYLVYENSSKGNEKLDVVVFNFV